MEIYFELKSNQEILIKCKDKIIGSIFTPSSSGHNVSNAIQICGFDRAFELWGCAVFVDDKEKHKQDIQLMFNENSQEAKYMTVSRACNSDCIKCFNKFDDVDAGIFKHKKYIIGKKCTCDELTVVREKDLPAEIITQKNKLVTK